MFVKKNRRPDLYSRAPKKRKSFFEKKEENPKRNPILLRVVFRLLSAFFVASVFYVLLFSPFLEIDKVYLYGIQELSYDQVEGKIKEELEGRYFHIFSKSNLLLASEENIREELKNNFKKISQVEVKKIFSNTVVVSVTERKSLLVWCSSDACFLVDEKGYAYLEADFESEEIKQNNLINIVDTGGKPVNSGEKIISDDYIIFVSSLREELERETGIKIKNEYQTQSRVADEAKVMTEEGWSIYFSSAFPLRESLETLKTFLDKEKSLEKNKIEYIDLRAQNKVYYKIRTETQEASDGEEKPQNNEENEKEDKKKD